MGLQLSVVAQASHNKYAMDKTMERILPTTSRRNWLAAILLIAACSGCGTPMMYHFQHYHRPFAAVAKGNKTYFHSAQTGKIIPREPCATYREPGCFGYEPTAWTRWPEQCTSNCPVQGDEMISEQEIAVDGEVYYEGSIVQDGSIVEYPTYAPVAEEDPSAPTPSAPDEPTRTDPPQSLVPEIPDDIESAVPSPSDSSKSIQKPASKLDEPLAVPPVVAMDESHRQSMLKELAESLDTPMVEPEPALATAKPSVVATKPSVVATKPVPRRERVADRKPVSVAKRLPAVEVPSLIGRRSMEQAPKVSSAMQNQPPKVAPPIVIEPKRPETKTVVAKKTEANVAESKAAKAKVADSKKPEPKLAEPKLPVAKVAEMKAREVQVPAATSLKEKTTPRWPKQSQLSQSRSASRRLEKARKVELIFDDQAATAATKIVPRKKQAANDKSVASIKKLPATSAAKGARPEAVTTRSLAELAKPVDVVDAAPLARKVVPRRAAVTKRLPSQTAMKPGATSVESKTAVKTLPAKDIAEKVAKDAKVPAAPSVALKTNKKATNVVPKASVAKSNNTAKVTEKSKPALQVVNRSKVVREADGPMRMTIGSDAVGNSLSLQSKPKQNVTKMKAGDVDDNSLRFADKTAKSRTKAERISAVAEEGTVLIRFR